MTHKTTWQFSALDTWFFRESRPHDSAGGSQLSSLFPPPARTIAGAIRTFVGESNHIDWQAFKDNKQHPMRQTIGYADDMGSIQLSGPWLTDNGQRLYPVPAYLMSTTSNGQTQYFHLRLGTAVTCDIGHVRLPELAKEQRNAKSLDNTYLTQTGLSAVLNGSTPNPSDIIKHAALFSTEPRLGIGRNNQRRTAIDSQLYQTVHIRPQQNLAVEVDILGIPSDKLPSANKHMMRLGGEGRMASVTIEPHHQTLAPPVLNKKQRNVMLTLLTPATISNELGLPGMPMPNETKTPPTDITNWRMNINGIALTIHSAVLGKPQREGGWNLAEQRPRDVSSYLPAGSAWYCTLDDDIDVQDAVQKLHGHQIGEQTELGRGQLVVGLWPNP